MQMPQFYCFVEYVAPKWHHTMTYCHGNAFRIAVPPHWPLARYVNLRVAHAQGMPGTLLPSPRVSDPDMHQDTCVTHVPWCMPWSLISGFLWSRCRGKGSRHSGACTTRNFTYLVRGSYGRNILIFGGVLLESPGNARIWGVLYFQPEKAKPRCFYDAPVTSLSWVETFIVDTAKRPLTYWQRTKEHDIDAGTDEGQRATAEWQWQDTVRFSHVSNRLSEANCELLSYVTIRLQLIHSNR